MIYALALILIIALLAIAGVRWWRSRNLLVIPDSLRVKHVRVAAEPGVGKTILLAQIAASDIAQNVPTVIVDLQGNLIDETISLLLHELTIAEAVDRLYYVSFSPEYERVFGFPLLGHLFPMVCKRVWSYLEQGSPLFDMVSKATLDVLHAARLESEEPAHLRLTESLKFLRDDAFRAAVIESCADVPPESLDFWVNTYDNVRRDTQLKLRTSTENKVAAVCTNPMLTASFCQEAATLAWDELERRRKTLLLDLSGVVDEAGQPDEDTQKIIAHAFLTTLLANRFRRNPSECRTPLSLILDEFAALYQTASASDFHAIQARARNYNLWLTVAMQQVLMIDNPQMTRALFSLNTQVIGRQNEYASALAVVQNLMSYDPEAQRLVNEGQHEVPTEQDRRHVVEVQRLPDRVWLARTQPGRLDKKRSKRVDRDAFRHLVGKVKLQSQIAHGFPQVKAVLAKRQARIAHFARTNKPKKVRRRRRTRSKREKI